MSQRTMFDAVDANAVPSSGFDLLAGYVDGGYRSYIPLQHRFPGVTVVSIDVLNHPGAGQVCDIEQGDARPDEAPDWFDKSVRAGITRPTLYYSTSNHELIRSYMGRRKYDAWPANYSAKACPVKSDGQITVVAWQRINHGPHGENIDISDVYDPYWPLAAPAPTPTKPPTWNEIGDDVKQSYVQVPTGADGKGSADLGTPDAPVGIVPDLDVRNSPGFTFATVKMSSGHHAIVVAGAPANGHIGFYVTEPS